VAYVVFINYQHSYTELVVFSDHYDHFYIATVQMLP